MGMWRRGGRGGDSSTMRAMSEKWWNQSCIFLSFSPLHPPCTFFLITHCFCEYCLVWKCFLFACLNWMWLDTEYWRATWYPSQGHLCRHNYSEARKAFHFKAVWACVLMCMPLSLCSTFPWLDMVTSLRPFKVHHVLWKRGKLLPANPRGILVV